MSESTFGACGSYKTSYELPQAGPQTCLGYVANSASNLPRTCSLAEVDELRQIRVAFLQLLLLALNARRNHNQPRE